MTISQIELFKRLVQLETDKLTTTEDVNQLKKDATFDEDDNPKGLSKEDVKNIHSAAKLEAKNAFNEFKEKNDAVIEKYNELVNQTDEE